MSRIMIVLLYHSHKPGDLVHTVELHYMVSLDSEYFKPLAADPHFCIREISRFRATDQSFISPLLLDRTKGICLFRERAYSKTPGKARCLCPSLGAIPLAARG
jgi:hypothetical protein